MSNELSEIIRQRIREIAAGLNESRPWEQVIASQYQLLPLFWELGDCLGLRPDLEIIAIPDNPEQGIHIETNPFWRNKALYWAGRKYPELARLVPVKPADAIDCPDCDGTGINPITAFEGYEDFICLCGGLGWVPEGADFNHFIDYRE